MALRTGHGNGAGQPRIEVLPVDELPAGVPDPNRPSEAAVKRDQQGRIADGATARELGARGGKAKAGKTRLARKMGLATLPDSADFAPYKRAANAYRRFRLKELAATVGGGRCGSGPSSIIATAAWQLATSRYLFDLASQKQDPALFTQASRLANDARQNELAAFELCVREAQARPPEAADVPWLIPAPSSPKEPTR